MVAKIVGIRKSKTKSGKEAFNIFYVSQFNKYDTENTDVVGVTCGSQFTYTDYALAVGDTVNFVFEPGYEGKATLTDVVPLKTPFDSPVTDNTKSDKSDKSTK